MSAEFLPPPLAAAPPAAPAGSGPASVLDDSALMSASEQSLPSQDPAAGGAVMARPGSGQPAAGAEGAAPDGAEAAGRHSAAGASAAPAANAVTPPLMNVGMGEAGWGCPGAAQQYRGCKWTARAGLVLQLPDHAGLHAAQQAQQAQQQAAAAALAEGMGAVEGTGEQQPGQAPPADGAGAAPGGGSRSGSGGAASEQAGDGTGPSRLPVYLFRSWALQLEGQGQAAKGLEKVDWCAGGWADSAA